MELETRFEGVWATGSLDGVGVLRDLSRSGTWIDATKVRPPIGARVRLVILDLEEERDPVLVKGVVVRSRRSLGFAVAFHAASSLEVGLRLPGMTSAD